MGSCENRHKLDSRGQLSFDGVEAAASSVGRIWVGVCTHDQLTLMSLRHVHVDMVGGQNRRMHWFEELRDQSLQSARLDRYFETGFFCQQRRVPGHRDADFFRCDVAPGGFDADNFGTIFDKACDLSILEDRKSTRLNSSHVA